jgi:hypothetical protein
MITYCLQESILNAIALKEEAADKDAKKVADEEAVLNIFVDPPGAAKPTKHLVVCITTDRGLCGSVNSSLARMARKEINAALKAKSDITLFVLGDKGRAQVSGGRRARGARRGERPGASVAARQVLPAYHTPYAIPRALPPPSSSPLRARRSGATTCRS